MPLPAEPSYLPCLLSLIRFLFMFNSAGEGRRNRGLDYTEFVLYHWPSFPALWYSSLRWFLFVVQAEFELEILLRTGGVTAKSQGAGLEFPCWTSLHLDLDIRLFYPHPALSTAPPR